MNVCVYVCSYVCMCVHSVYVLCTYVDNMPHTGSQNDLNPFLHLYQPTSLPAYQPTSPPAHQPTSLPRVQCTCIQHREYKHTKLQPNDGLCTRLHTDKPHWHYGKYVRKYPPVIILLGDLVTFQNVFTKKNKRK